MRIVRMCVAATVVTLLLGCAGLTEALEVVSGADIQMGENLAMPPDFPMAAPPGGNVVAVMSLPAGGTMSTTVTVQLEGDGAGVLESYQQQMQAAGMTVTRTNTGQGDTISGQAGTNRIWTASLNRQGDQSQLILVVLEGPGAATGEPPEAAIPGGGPAEH